MKTLLRTLTAVLFLSCSYYSHSDTAIDKPCSKPTLEQLYSPGGGEVHIQCNLTLRPDSVIHKKLIIEGGQASNIEIDCAGSRLKRGLSVRAKRLDKLNKGNPGWSVPANIKISNCITESITHVYGMAFNGESTYLTESSRRKGHTKRVQSNAPYGIHLSNFTTETKGAIPFYFGPGVTKSSITQSKISGQSNSVAIYLDAESAHNRIEGNLITTTTGRELIAIDGSAHNQIRNNRLNALSKGGIYLYRNCGEGGNIRHQSPQHNLIEGNRFYYNKYKGRNPSIWLASRNGRRNYCGHDKGYDLGSSASDKDFAQNNKVINNRFINYRLIRDDDEGNLIQANDYEGDAPREACFLGFCF